ncbi:discoidin domain-containing protein [Archangium gephyra]|uniref:Hemagglutinin protein n=1 Tax=Archangium gephyra TaxID=48 RepID=A0AAC8TB01_9BACT|nr:discoidin domain-containing protein [Archangium gephyra]AKI99444.1 hemagglutinin protein [Archangium gephyra]
MSALALGAGLAVGCGNTEQEAGSRGPPEPYTEATAEQALSTSCAQNLALGKPVTSSGYWADGTPERAVDGDTATTWRTNQSTGAWLRVDLGGVRAINRAMVMWVWDKNYGTSAQSVLEGSTDGTSWTLLKTLGHTGADNGFAQYVSFPTTSARYVRFRGTQWNGGWGHMNELQVFGPESTCTAPTVEAAYDATLKAPRCGGTFAVCDTGTLVTGRAQLGPELNAPNTLQGSCADGTAGAYHSDESLDRLVVSTVDGGPIAPGKQVRISATAWVWGSSADWLDLYSTTNPHAPTWQHLATLTPVASGLQTLSTTFVLPSSGGLQAIRGQFRYSGSNASPCGGGAYDDRDDLVFSVACPVWYADADGDGRGDASTAMVSCTQPAGYVAAANDNCPSVSNPDQADADGDGVGDVCAASGRDCGDLTESNILQRWTAWSSDNAQTALSVLDASDSVRGSKALRAVTQSGFDFAVRFTPAAGASLDVFGYEQLRLAVRGKNTTPIGWQGNFPVVVLQDAAGRRRTYTPNQQFLTKDGLTWTPVTVPLAGNATWSVSGDVVDLHTVKQVEVHADTWDSGFTLDVDAVSFEHPQTVCGVQCPGGCSGRGTCDSATLACTCDLGYGGSACNSCAPGFVQQGTQCVLPADGNYTEWPNAVSRANSDAWLAVHHARIQTLRPKVLALNFVNPSDPTQVSQLVDRVINAFAEGSKVQGYKNAAAPAQLQYQLAKPIIDLRDGANGRPPPPAGFPYQNSTLYPRRPSSESGYWRFDYATLFEQGFAQNYGYVDPANPARYLTLCELVERGDLHELWLIGSGDVASDVNAAEVLEAKPRYTATGNQIPNSVERCAGNGCFDADVPACARSVRIGFVNYNRGPGCYVHSHGHGLESTSNNKVVPALTEWFTPLAKFDLNTRHNLPIRDWYGLSCSSPPCLSFPTDSSAQAVHQGLNYSVNPYDGVCGNVHFPPNGRDHYDYGSAAYVRSSCTGFGRHQGGGGADASELVNKDSWSRYLSVAPDCGGEFLVWWFQNMPGYGSGQTYADGRPMPSLWPYFFY